MRANGGLTKGKSHAKGGIDMVVKSTGQKIEVEGGEGIINKHVMSDDKKYDFEGKEMTACEISSNLNQRTGNGVKFSCEETKHTDMTPTDTTTGFGKGGEVEMIECQNCGWDWKVSDGGDDLYICHKCNTDNEFAKGGGVHTMPNGEVILKYVNFEDGWHINLKRLKDYINQNKGNNKYVIIRQDSRKEQELWEFETLNEANAKFNELVELGKTYSKIEKQFAKGGKTDTIKALNNKFNRLNKKYVTLDNSWSDNMTKEEEEEVSSKLENIQTEMSIVSAELEKLEDYAKGGNVTIVNELEKFDKKRYPAIMGDFDGDGIINADDPTPRKAVKNKKTIEQVQFNQTFEKLLDLKSGLDATMHETVGKLKVLAPKDADIYARTKTPYSILKKLVEKRLVDKQRGLADLVGTTIVVSNYKDLQKVDNQVEEGEFGKVFEREDMYKNPKGGYRAIHYTIDVEDTLVELQLKTKRQKAINELSHDAYKQGTLNSKRLLEVTKLADDADKGDKKAIAKYDALMKNKNKLASELGAKFEFGGDIVSNFDVAAPYGTYAKGGEIGQSVGGIENIDKVYVEGVWESGYDYFQRQYTIKPKNNIDSIVDDWIQDDRGLVEYRIFVVTKGGEEITVHEYSDGGYYAKGGDVSGNDMLKLDAKSRKVAIPKAITNITLSPENLELDKVLSGLSSSDDLRPVMMGINFDAKNNEVAVTDAHKLIRLAYDGELNNIYATQKRLTSEWKRANKSSAPENRITYEEYLKVFHKTLIIEGTYPNVDAVISEPHHVDSKVDLQKLYWFIQSLIKSKYRFDPVINNETNKIYLQVLDHQKEKVILSFNANFLSTLSKSMIQLSNFWGGETTIPYQCKGIGRSALELFPTPKRLPKNTGLLMPLMSESEDSLSSVINPTQEDFKLNVIYDLDTNTVYSNGKYHAIDESVGFIPRGSKAQPKKTETIKITRAYIEKRIKALELTLEFLD